MGGIRETPPCGRPHERGPRSQRKPRSAATSTYGTGYATRSIDSCRWIPVIVEACQPWRATAYWLLATSLERRAAPRRRLAGKEQIGAPQRTRRQFLDAAG